MNRKLQVLQLALLLPALAILVVPTKAAILREFDWNTPPDPNGPTGCAMGAGFASCGDWPNPPWNSGYNQGSAAAGFTHLNNTGQVHNVPLEIFPGVTTPTFMALGENTAPPGGDPNAILNLDLVTFSFDAMRDGSVDSVVNGLGFYPYDLINGATGVLNPDDSQGLGANNQGVLPWAIPNGGVNTNFLSASLDARDPDAWYHYDVVINASYATVGSGANEVPHFHWMVFLDGEPLWIINDPDVDPNDPPIQYTLDTLGPGGYGISDPNDPNSPPAEGAGIDGWQFKSFHEGLWYIDNFKVRDEFFVQSAGTPGDFNGDGHVDGLDFLEWQRDPSIGDLADWEANYGTWPPAAASSAVPEPTSAVLLVLTGSLALLGNSQRKREMKPKNMSGG